MITIRGAINPEDVGVYNPSNNTLVVSDHVEIYGGYTFTKPVDNLQPSTPGTYSLTTTGASSVRLPSGFSSGWKCLKINADTTLG